MISANTAVESRRRSAGLASLRVALAQRGWGMHSVFSRGIAYSFWFGLFAFAMCVSIFGVNIVTPMGLENTITLFSFFAVGVVAFLGIYCSTHKYPFTLNSAHWIFIAFFFFYAAIVQFMSHRSPDQDDVGCFYDEAFKTNILILAWCLVYWISYRLTYHKKAKPSAPPKPSLPPQHPDYFLALGLVFFATVVAVLVYGLTGLTSRYQVGQAAQQLNNSALQGVIGHFCRGVPIMTFALILINRTKRDLVYYVVLLAVVGCTFLCDDPVSVARFLAGTMALGVIGSLIRKKKINGLWLPICLVLGLIFAMPVLNLARRTSFSQINWAEYSPSDIQSTLDFGDFDAYQMFADTVHLPDDQISWGQQVAGNVLYWIPRAMWPTKPGGSGAYVATFYNLGFTNVAESLPAEGYVNFGYIGILIYAMIFGWVLAKYDKYYWSTIDRPDAVPPTLMQLFYPFMVGLVIYLMRGDFQSAFEDATGLMIAGWIVMKIAYPSLMRRRNNRFFARHVETANANAVAAP